MNLFDRIFAAMVLRKIAPAEVELVSCVETYLRRTADAAVFMLPKETIDYDFGDAFSGEDDSCNEDE